MAMLALVALGCTETTAPEEKKQVTLEVRAFVLSQTGAAVPVPARGAEIRLYDVAPDESLIDPSIDLVTGPTGLVTYTLDNPINGKKVAVLGTYLGNRARQTVSLVLCNDTSVTLYFDPQPPPPVNCSQLANNNSSLRFIDERGVDTLRQNSGVNQSYEVCRTLFVNTGATPIRIEENAAPAAPFAVLSYSVSGAAANLPVDVPPGGDFSVCYRVSTADIGSFNTTHQLRLGCGNNSAIWTVQLGADVVQQSCDCPTTPPIASVGDSATVVRVGDTETFSVVAYTNTASCPISINLVPGTPRRTNDWRIGTTLPSPLILQPNQSLSFPVIFTPTQVGFRNDSLRFRVELADGTLCDTLIIPLIGKGCVDTCPMIQIQNVFYPFGQRQPVVRISNTPDERVTFAGSCLTNPASPLSRDITIAHTILSCDPAQVTISIADTALPAFSAQFFSVDRTSMIIAGQPGDTISRLRVSFRPPTLGEFQQIYLARGGQQRTIDSTFSVVVTLRAGNCEQKVTVEAIVTNRPNLSPVRNLRAYSQSTLLKTVPEYEVYLFEDLRLQQAPTDNVISLRVLIPGGTGTLQPVRPDSGDIYVNVDDTTAGPVVSKQPYLYLAGGVGGRGFTHFARFRSSFPEQQFDQVQPVLSALEQDIINAGGVAGYFNTANPQWRDRSQRFTPAPGDIYMFWNGAVDPVGGRPCEFAMIYIRQVNFGPEANTNNQSAIEFRALYPIR